MPRSKTNALPDVLTIDESAHVLRMRVGDMKAIGMLLKVPDAAEILSVGRSTIYNLIAEGELETVHIGRSVRVVTASIEEFIDRQRDQVLRW